MNKYIYSVADLDSYFIEYFKVVAHNLKEAQEKVMNRYYNEYEWDYQDNWRDFTLYALDNNTLIGDLKDIETF